MNGIATKTSDIIDMTTIEAKLKDKTASELKDHLHQRWNGIAQFVAECAVCVKLLEARGESLAGIPWVGTYRRVAYGQVLPEIVSEFIESPNRQIVESLPAGDQRKVADDPMILVAEAMPEGGWTKRKVDLRTAPRDVAKLVVGPDGIRSFEEQQAHLAAQKARPATKRPAEREDEIQEPLAHSVTIRLTESEWKAIRLYAAENGYTERKATRMFLIRSTLFKPVKA